MKQKRLIGVMCLAVLVFNIAAFAGNLEPSSLPGPTMKTLDQVEPRTAITSIPYTITQGGSYYLTGSLTMGSNTSGITINADNVTIDLCGFTLDGNKLVQSAINANTRKNIVVKNGNIINWYLYGVYLLSCTDSKIENISTNNTGFSGIRVGTNSMISNCIVTGNRATNCAAITVTGTGTGSTVIKNCVVSDSNYIGISLSSPVASTVIECTTRNNKHSGIYATYTAVIKDCVSTDNAEYGIRVSNGGIVSGCVANNNGCQGIYLDASTAINNQCNSNGSGYPASGAGIMIQGTGCRVEGNTANSNTKYGFFISSTNNIVVKNFARGNGTGASANYSSSGGNVGPIVSDMTTTSPWANFSF